MTDTHRIKNGPKRPDRKAYWQIQRIKNHELFEGAGPMTTDD